MQNQDEEFDKLTTTTPKRKRRKIVEDDTDEENDMENEGLEDLDMSAEESVTKTIQVGDKNFTFSFA